jgi:hypothetical protein
MMEAHITSFLEETTIRNGMLVVLVISKVLLISMDANACQNHASID